MIDVQTVGLVAISIALAFTLYGLTSHPKGDPATSTTAQHEQSLVSLTFFLIGMYLSLCVFTAMVCHWIATHVVIV